MAQHGKTKPKQEKPLTESDIMKYEIAGELGLLDKVKSTGWRSLTAKESGRIGGIMTRRRRTAAGGGNTNNDTTMS